MRKKETAARGAHVMTVLGPVAPETLGAVLMHEHLICDLTPPARRNSGDSEVQITLETAFDINYRPADYFGNHRNCSPLTAR